MKINIHDAILIALAAGTILGCKKDAPPVPKINHYKMEIQITDNSPFGNVSALFAMGNTTYLQDQLKGVSTGQDFVYPLNPAVYVQREISFSDYDSSAAFVWIGSTAVFDNWYNVRVFKNDSLCYQVAGYQIDQAIQIN